LLLGFLAGEAIEELKELRRVLSSSHGRILFYF